METFEYFDAHSHLHDEAFDQDREEVIGDLFRRKIGTITVGTDIANSRRAAELARVHPHIWASVGQHPVDRRDETFDPSEYAPLLHSRVVAIGECGIDYFRMSEYEGNKDAEADRQKTLFEDQMRFAAIHDLPLMIHGRPERGTMDAYEDIIHILRGGQKEYGQKVRGNIHFFVGDIDIARQFLDLGFTMSFSGVVTFTHEYDEVVKYIPSHSILVETDSPYVAPTPHRGKRNEPKYVVETTASIAKLRGVELGEFAHIVVDNVTRMFLLR